MSHFRISKPKQSSGIEGSLLRYTVKITAECAHKTLFSFNHLGLSIMIKLNNSTDTRTNYSGYKRENIATASAEKRKTIYTIIFTNNWERI